MPKRSLLIASAATVAALVPASAHAQSNGQDQQSSSHADQGKPAKPKADAPKPSHLLGNWAKPLSDKGVDITLKYEGDLAASLSGGKDRGADYAQQLELNAKLDWGKIAGIKGLSSTVTFVNRSGKSLAHNHIGDQLTQVETIYGGTRHSIVHLVQAFFDWKSDGGTVDIAAGRLPAGNDFGTSPYYCEFMNTSVCAYPNSVAAKRGFTSFPNSTWGARLRIAPDPQFYVQVGAYQVRPKLGGSSGFDWGWSGTTGTYIPVEAGWEPSFGPDDLNGHYKVGVTTDTSHYSDNLYDSSGVPYPLSGNPPAKHDTRHSAYVLADQMVRRNGKGPENGLVLLGGLSFSDPATSTVARSGFAGIRDQGLIPGRPDDTAGLIASYLKASDRLAERQELTGDPAQSDELVVEGYYKIAAADGLTVSPDIQYLVHPDARKSIPNALAVAARLDINF